MTQIDATIARIPTMTPTSRAALRKNAEVRTVRQPGDTEARRVIEALDTFEDTRPKTATVEVTGLLAWEKYRPGEATFRAFHGEEAVGRIFKRADHSMTDKDGYSVEILGQAVEGVFHHIRDARKAGERAFTARQGTGK